MQRRLWMALMAATVLVSVSACSAHTQALLEQERQNGAQFATWDHMGYSVFRGTPQTTTKQDIVAAQQEKWWGDVVRVAPIM